MQFAAEIVDYIKREPDSRIFVTSVIPDLASMYPMRIWQHNLDRILQEMESPEEAEEYEFWANSHGACTSMDNLGRVVIPAKLRQMLSLDGEQLILVPARSRLDVYKQFQFDEREQQLAPKVPDVRKMLLRRGVL
ncbi:MAG: MraZ N-terminal domain containing protein [Bryobacterales bacterium]|jgi:DNA-binding transcriptional regulator/RsmH inhibitor MraZ|nr:MraZ N-terminal domain containing protein [Bryobacterales bacterium]